MRSYSIEDLLVDTYYRPISLRRRYQGGVIDFAEKRDDVYLSEGYQAYRVRFDNGRQWATVAVKVED